MPATRLSYFDITATPNGDTRLRLCTDAGALRNVNLSEEDLYDILVEVTVALRIIYINNKQTDTGDT